MIEVKVHDKDLEGLHDANVYSTEEVAEMTHSQLIPFLGAWACHNCHGLNFLKDDECRHCGVLIRFMEES